MFGVGHVGRQMIAAKRGAGPPSLALDFMTPGSLPSGLTFTRASTATYFDDAGTMQTATTNTPRWDYSPSTLTLNGLLIEEARTNNSTDYTGYTISNTSHVPASGIAPDGTNTMVKLAEGTSTSAHYNNRIATLAAGTMYTLSVYAKAVERRYIQLYGDDGGANGGYATFDLQTGTISQPLTVRGTGVTGTATIQAVSNGIYRCTVSVQVAVTTYRCGVILSPTSSGAFAPSYAGVVGSGALIWGLQLEAGAFPTSYIPTTATSVTRSADLASLPTAAWFTAAGGTYQAEFIPNGSPSTLPSIVSGNAGSPVIALGGDARLSTAIRNVVALLDALGPACTFGAVNKGALVYLSGASRTATNGTAFGPNAAAFSVTGTVVQLGSDGVTPGANALDGWLRRVRYWPRVLTNAELQSVTM